MAGHGAVFQGFCEVIRLEISGVIALAHILAVTKFVDNTSQKSEALSSTR